MSHKFSRVRSTVLLQVGMSSNVLFYLSLSVWLANAPNSSSDVAYEISVAILWLLAILRVGLVRRVLEITSELNTT